jgi:hypothetical protein
MAKGQKRSNREAKKPKKTAAERLTTITAAAATAQRISLKEPPKKA